MDELVHDFFYIDIKALGLNTDGTSTCDWPPGTGKSRLDAEGFEVPGSGRLVRGPITMLCFDRVAFGVLLGLLYVSLVTVLLGRVNPGQDLVPASANSGGCRWNSRCSAVVICSCSTFSGSSLSSRARDPAIFCVIRDITAVNISSWSWENGPFSCRKESNSKHKVFVAG